MIKKSIKVLIFIAVLFFVWHLFIVRNVPDDSLERTRITREEKESRNTVKIGVILPLTGQNSAQGEFAKLGIGIAVQDINSKGGINGKQIEVALEDSQGSPDIAKEILNKFIREKEIDIIIGGHTEEEAIALSPIAQENKILLINTMASSRKLDDVGDYVFKMHESLIPHAKEAAKAVFDSGNKYTAIVTAENDYCSELTDLLHSELPSLGISIISEEKFSIVTADFNDLINRLNEKDFDSLYICGHSEDAGSFVLQAKEAGITKPMYSSEIIQSRKFAEASKGEADGIIYTGSRINCGDQGSSADLLCSLYIQKYSDEISYDTAYAYDSIMMLIHAVEVFGPYIDDLKQGLINIEFDGATGKTVFDQYGNAKKEVILKTLKDGEFIEYEK